MQVGRWNHQGASGSRRDARPFNPDEFIRGARSARPVRRPARFGSTVRSGNKRRGAYPPRIRRGGVGAFGQTESEIATFINRAEVKADEPAFIPEHTFEDLNVNALLKANIVAKGYKLPTPIQDKAIPHVLDGKDVVGLAETGTGKTAAFLIPLIDKVMTSCGEQHKKERVLIMAPTRELAVQIEVELAGFARGLGFSGMVAVGGANIKPQITALKHNPSFVIGTPGRLKDLMERKALDLSSFGTVVLDEADRMLDMGFIDDMRFILSKMRSEHHTLLFSATMSKEVERLVGEFTKNPVVISVKTQDTSKNVDQDIVRVPRVEDKFETLLSLLQDRDFSRVLIFCRTKYGAEKLAKALSRSHVFAESIHGNKTYGARLRALDALKRGRVVALVATDVAARGLDIPDVSHVINYDLPSTYDDYVHRIGRTGRATAKGKALTFVEER